MNYTINECLGSTLGIHILLICLALILHGDMIGCNLFAFLRYGVQSEMFFSISANNERTLVNK